MLEHVVCILMSSYLTDSHKFEVIMKELETFGLF